MTSRKLRALRNLAVWLTIQFAVLTIGYLIGYSIGTLENAALILERNAAIRERNVAITTCAGDPR